jgi:uncharacterized repeat protein (TIGR03803 family)
MFSKYTIQCAFLALFLASCGYLFGQTKETLFSFPGGAMGSEPFSGLVMDESGNFYGTTFGSETLPSSSVAFKLSRTSIGWKETVLHLFTGQGDGINPAAGVTLDGKGNIFGTTQYGGTANCTDGYGSSCGTVYEISPNGSGGWNEKVLYSFPSTGATNPIGGVILDPLGNLYGTASIGGISSCPASNVGCGSVYKLLPGSDGWTFKTLHYFHWMQSRPDGALPQASLFEDAQHNLYGTTEAGGTAGVGSVFELSPTKAGAYTISLPGSFRATGDSGFQPSGGLVRDKQGNFYGTTSFGGTVNSTCQNGCGTVFELSPGTSGWRLQTLYSFQGGTDGMLPLNTTLALDPKGNLYGVTVYGGNNDCSCGVVFELSPLTGGGWSEKVLYAFQGGTDGGFPTGSIVVDPGGNVYGTTPTGGVNSAGTVYKITP